jgi:hypothetical protein
MGLRTRIFLLLCTTLFIGACASSEELSRGKAVVGRFHEELNSGLFDDIYREASPEYQKSVTQEMNGKLLAGIGKKMGIAGQFRMTSWRLNAMTNGRFLELQGDADFANGKAVETFQWRIEGNRILMVSWNVNSPQLLIN